MKQKTLLLKPAGSQTGREESSAIVSAGRDLAPLRHNRASSAEYTHTHTHTHTPQIAELQTVREKP